MVRIVNFLLLGCCLSFAGCGVYSFSGASIPAGAKTVSVAYFQNNAPIVQPTLSQVLTEALQDKFMSETNLSLVDKGGDLHFEGVIVNYAVSPIAIQANESAAMNRLTVKVKVAFVNKIEEKFSYQSSFSKYADYPQGDNLSDKEEELIAQIVEELVDEIFNKAVVNW